MKRAVLFLLLGSLMADAGCVATENKVSGSSLSGIPNAVVYENNIIVGGAPTAEGLTAARNQGVRAVIDLRTEPDLTTQEALQVKELGMNYYRIPISSPESIGPVDVAMLEGILTANADSGVLLHCASGRRAGALWKAYQAQT